MSRFEFKLPDLGEGTVDAEIVEWKVKVGDMVKDDQVIVEVMTDKATSKFRRRSPAPWCPSRASRATWSPSAPS